MVGSFAPGERIDPTRLAPELVASVTPIRDALHRLAGERLVESSSQDGFRQPLVGETALRHLYGWSEDLVRIVLRAGERDRVSPSWFRGDSGDDYPAVVARLFDGLGRLSPNLEHRAMLTSLNERLWLVRSVEPTVVPNAEADLQLIDSAIISGDWIEARRTANHYHAVRLRRVPEIARTLLDRTMR